MIQASLGLSHLINQDVDISLEDARKQCSGCRYRDEMPQESIDAGHWCYMFDKPVNGCVKYEIEESLETFKKQSIKLPHN